MNDQIRALNETRLVYVGSQLKERIITQLQIKWRLHFRFRRSELDFQQAANLLMHYAQLQGAEDLHFLQSVLRDVQQIPKHKGNTHFPPSTYVTITGFILIYCIVQARNGDLLPSLGAYLLRKPLETSELKLDFDRLQKHVRQYFPVYTTAVILTPIKEEFQAVYRQMIQHTPVQEVIQPDGTIYLHCRFRGRHQVYNIYLRRTESGLQSTATYTSQVITDLQPDLILLVGNAAGIKERLKIGDIVVGDRAYEYQSGSVENGQTFYRPRETRPYSESIVERAKIMINDTTWKKRITYGDKVFPDDLQRLAEVDVGPIVSGDKTIKDTNSELMSFIRIHCNDAIAAEKEATGILNATRRTTHIEVANIRSISDLADAKNETDRLGYKVLAASHASAFAFELLNQWKKKVHASRQTAEALITNHR